MHVAAESPSHLHSCPLVCGENYRIVVPHCCPLITEGILKQILAQSMQKHVCTGVVRRTEGQGRAYCSIDTYACVRDAHAYCRSPTCMCSHVNGICPQLEEHKVGKSAHSSVYTLPYIAGITTSLSAAMYGSVFRNPFLNQGGLPRLPNKDRSATSLPFEIFGAHGGKGSPESAPTAAALLSPQSHRPPLALHAHGDLPVTEQGPLCNGYATTTQLSQGAVASHPSVSLTSLPLPQWTLL